MYRVLFTIIILSLSTSSYAGSLPGSTNCVQKSDWNLGYDNGSHFSCKAGLVTEKLKFLAIVRKDNCWHGLDTDGGQPANSLTCSLDQMSGGTDVAAHCHSYDGNWRMGHLLDQETVLAIEAETGVDITKYRYCGDASKYKQLLRKEGFRLETPGVVSDTTLE